MSGPAGLERHGRKAEARTRLTDVMTPFRFEARSADVAEATAVLQAGTRKRPAHLRSA